MRSSNSISLSSSSVKFNNAYVRASATYHAVFVLDYFKLKLLLKAFTFYYLCFFCSVVSYFTSETCSFFWAIFAASSTYFGENILDSVTLSPGFNNFAFL